jgi:hypothetical protein
VIAGFQLAGFTAGVLTGGGARVVRGALHGGR